MKKIIVAMMLMLNMVAFSVNLNEAEKEWIKNNRGKTIDVNEAYPTDIFLYQSEDGKFKGIYKEFFDKISVETGLSFNIQKVSRAFYSENIGREEYLGVFLQIARLPIREEIVNFQELVNSYNVVMIWDRRIKGTGNQEFSGKKIGVISTTSEDKAFGKKYSEVVFEKVELVDREEGFRKLKSGEIDYFLGKTSYIECTEYSFEVLNEIERMNFFMGINRNHRELNSIIEKYHKEFTGAVLDESIRRNRIEFYREYIKNDVDYLKLKANYPVLKVLFQKESYLLPFYYEKDGEFEGYLPDYYEAIGEILDIPVEFIRVPEDGVLPEYHIRAISSLETPNHKQIYPYYNVKNVIVGRTKNDYITDLNDLKNYKVGMKGYLKVYDNLKENTVQIDSYDTAIEGLLNGKYDYLIGEFRILSSIIANQYLRDEIKIAGIVPGEYYIYPEVPIEHSELINVLQKVTRPYIGEGYYIKTSLNKLIFVNPNYKKYGAISLVVFLIMGTLIYLLKYSKEENRKREKMLNSLIESFEMANHFSDEDTGMHIVRVNRYAQFLAEKYGGTRNFIKEIGKYSSLHDVGKIGIPDSILQKPGKLSDEEMKEMRTHVEIGYELVKKMNVGAVAENIVRYHHERWDGDGYIKGLKGEMIPLEARIVALVDVYDALRQKRVYKEAFSHEKAVEIIKGESGKAFDPMLVNLFLLNNSNFKNIFEEGQE